MSAVDGVWTCSRCTLDNRVSSLTCAACGWVRLPDNVCPECTLEYSIFARCCPSCGSASSKVRRRESAESFEVAASGGEEINDVGTKSGNSQSRHDAQATGVMGWACSACSFWNMIDGSRLASSRLGKRWCFSGPQVVCSACGLDRDRRKDSLVLDHAEPVPERAFGIELELIRHSVRGASLEEIADELSLLGLNCKSLGYTKRTTEFWKLVPDRSVQGSVDDLGFEVVSPILHGQSGVQDVAIALQVLNLAQVSVNETTGLHIHIDAGYDSLDSVKKVCANFLQYEEAFDLLLPLARRQSANEYCRSNRKVMISSSMKDVHEKIRSCNSFLDVAMLCNPARDNESRSGDIKLSRYYKLNLTSLGRDSGPRTFEFRMPSGTASFMEVETWILLLLTFVQNTVGQAWPNVLEVPSCHTSEEALVLLFEQVIHNERLADRCLARAREIVVIECV